MILVDSSAWIDHLRDTATEQVSHLRSLMPGEELLVGDLVLREVLQGVRSDAEARLVEEALREVATFCIERGHSLLHSDRDYTPMQRFLGLQTI